MSGILDNKSRVLDVLATQEGRRQIAAGDLRIEYVSFTDAGTYYAADLQSGSRDATQRVFLEQSNLPQDQITFEADDSGKLQPFKNKNGIQVKDGQLINYSFAATEGAEISGSSESMRVLTGTEFASTSDELLGSMVDNFQRLQVIASKNLIFEDDGFAAGPSDITFTIHNERPIPDRGTWTSHVDHVESLFDDPRLSGIQNFKYLPPINRIDNETIDRSDHRATSDYQLGRYPPWGRTHLFPLTYEQIKFELDYYADLGYCKTVLFDPTSRDNRLILQMFEQGFNKLRKLDVIDFGQHATGDPASPTAHIFFVGRIFEDDNDTHTFVHLFTLLFE
jgi:hypothetical protein